MFNIANRYQVRTHLDQGEHGHANPEAKLPADIAEQPRELQHTGVDFGYGSRKATSKVDKIAYIYM